MHCVTSLILTANLPHLIMLRVVEFASHSDMKNAIDKLDGTDLNGRKLKLSEDRKREYVDACFPNYIVLFNKGLHGVFWKVAITVHENCSVLVSATNSTIDFLTEGGPLNLMKLRTC